MWKVGLLLLVILIFSYYVWTSYASGDYEKYLYGMWVGGESFCEDAGITNMMMFIGERKKNKRIAYVVIGPDVYNDTCEIKCPTASKKFKAKLIFTDEPPMPTDLTIDLDMMRGQMRLYSGDTLYGVLYKNHEITNETPD